MAGTDPTSHPDDPAARRLSAAAAGLVNRVGHWTRARWAAPAGPGVAGAGVAGAGMAGAGMAGAGMAGAGTAGEPGQTRADVVFGLIQRLADLGASAEHRPSRRVPRLDNDTALPDQLRVMVDDLLVAGAPAAILESGAAAIEAVAAGL